MWAFCDAEMFFALMQRGASQILKFILKWRPERKNILLYFFRSQGLLFISRRCNRPNNVVSEVTFHIPEQKHPHVCSEVPTSRWTVSTSGYITGCQEHKLANSVPGPTAASLLRNTRLSCCCSSSVGNPGGSQLGPDK